MPDIKVLLLAALGLFVLGFVALKLLQPPATEVKVILSEWKVESAIISVHPGRVKFVVTNKGTMEHAFEIEADEKELGELEHIAPGQTKALTVNLREGEYELYCPLPGHKDNGMLASFLVTPVQTQSLKP